MFNDVSQCQCLVVPAYLSHKKLGSKHRRMPNGDYDDDGKDQPSALYSLAPPTLGLVLTCFNCFCKSALTNISKHLFLAKEKHLETQKQSKQKHDSGIPS